MTTFAITLPLARTSPLHIPRRDMMLSVGDSLTLAVQVRASDRPDAALVDLTGGLGGPGLRVYIWADAPCFAWDYGALLSSVWGYGGLSVAPGALLWSGTGTVDADTETFSFTMPAGTLAQASPRCGWSIVYEDESGSIVQLLAWGAITLIGTGATYVAPTIITDDGGEPLLAT